MNDLKKMSNDIIYLNANLEKLNQDKGKANDDIDKYKSHIMFLTETNQRLLNELEDAYDRYQKMENILIEGERIPEYLNKNKYEIDMALNNLDSSLSRNNLQC